MCRRDARLRVEAIQTRLDERIPLVRSIMKPTRILLDEDSSASPSSLPMSSLGFCQLYSTNFTFVGRRRAPIRRSSS